MNAEDEDETGAQRRQNVSDELTPSAPPASSKGACRHGLQPVVYACTQCYVVYKLYPEEVEQRAPVCDYCGRRLKRVGEDNGKRKNRENLGEPDQKG